MTDVNDIHGIGPDLVRARDVDGEPWKVLMRRYGYGRTWLYRIYRAEKARSEAAARQKMFTEHLRAGRRAPCSLLNG